MTTTQVVDVFGTGVALCNEEQIAEMILNPGETGQFVAIGNVHSVMTARRDPDLATALRAAEAVTPDGMPLVWAMRAMGASGARRVTGIDVMTTTLERGVEDEVGHFFYGSSEEVLGDLVRTIRGMFPGVIVSGAMSPPYRRLTLDELQLHARQIRESGANVVWVGLGMPKQELWMHDLASALPGMSLVGVGAAFDWLAGKQTRAPKWMQSTGLEWLYRLGQDPGRLWKRYVLNNPLYLLLLISTWLRRAMSRRD